MKEKLHTQCPTCQTTFAVTSSQLEAHDGLVRCGRCSAVFHADQHLRDPSVKTKQKRKTEPVRPAPVSGEPRPKKASKEKKRADDSQIRDADSAQDSALQPGEFVSAALAEVLVGKRRVRTRTVFWALGSLLFVTALLGQTTFFYATELSRYPQLNPWVRSACEWLKCEIRPRQNVDLIEILHTSVRPHPNHMNALRIQASLVNRASFTQPYPLMEVTLTNSNGAAIARRTFLPREYLKTPPKSAGMVPHVVVEGLLDISNPASSTGGYEIRLLPG